jgi:hypothetical protein
MVDSNFSFIDCPEALLGLEQIKIVIRIITTDAKHLINLFNVESIIPLFKNFKGNFVLFKQSYFNITKFQNQYNLKSHSLASFTRKWLIISLHDWCFMKAC